MGRASTATFVSLAAGLLVSVVLSVSPPGILADKGGCPNAASSNGAKHANEHSAHGPEKQADRGCVGVTPTPGPTGGEIPTPTGNELTPTPTGLSTPTPTPTPTPAEGLTPTPTPTATPPEGLTPTPTPTATPPEGPTPTPTPTPSPTPV